MRALASLALLAPAFAAVPAIAAPRPLSADERAALRCGAAFAMVAAGQARSDPSVQGWPPMAERGREFFVRLTARLMDDAGLDRAAVSAAARAEADGLRRSGGLAGVRPFCLGVLDAQPAFTR